MACSTYYNISGQEITPDSMKIPKAIATYQALQRHNDFTLLQVIQTVENDLRYEKLCIEVEPGIVQNPKYDIKFREKLSLEFNEKDNKYPIAKALRKDFPALIHENSTLNGTPKSLCLYEQPFIDGKHSWTATNFLDKISHWLRESAKGTLHQNNQNLEPLFYPSVLGRIAIPYNIFNKLESGEKIVSRKIADNFFIIKEADSDFNPQKEKNFLPLYIELEPMTHGEIMCQPRVFSELNELGQSKDFLLNALKQDVRNLISNSKVDKNIVLILLVKSQLLRNNASTVPERTDYYCFYLSSLEEVAIKIGVAEIFNEKLGITILKDNKFVDFEILMLDIGFIPNKSMLLTYNTLKPESGPNSGLIIGAGSLGAKILELFFKMGWGTWTVIDNDIILPHNLARHHLGYRYLGHNKAKSMSFDLSFQEREEGLNYIETNFNDCKNHIFKNHDLIIDVSTSISVQRKLAIEIPGDSRRISCFLLPSGNGSVIFIEDSYRKIKLDNLEAQYYRLLIENDILFDDFSSSLSTQRYGMGCRDISVNLPFDNVVFHAGFISKIIRNKIKDNNAHIEVNYCDNDNKIYKYIPPTWSHREVHQRDKHGKKWIIVIDEYVINRIRSMRKKELPNETGSAIFGYHDTYYNRIYIVDVSKTPIDSIQTPTSFIRGKEGLFEYREHVTGATAGIVDYIGEWHSHPKWCSENPSCYDKKLLGELSAHLETEGLPAIMIIVGKNKIGYYLK